MSTPSAALGEDKPSYSSRFPKVHPISKSPLRIYRLLSPTSGLRVSPLCLGALNFGTSWASRMGSCPKPTAFSILDTFYAAGGNFIDTANTYHVGESETWLGEWMAERQCREDMVLATKYTGSYGDFDLYAKTAESEGRVLVNTVGNGAKSLVGSVKQSLRNLQTDYIDILYVHFWDYTTGVEEVMMSLNALVQQGKVLYLGISDTPAWIVVKANAFARQHGLRPFVVYQGQWSIKWRDFEREILPMCAAENMGVAPFGALGSGLFKTKEEREEADSGRSKQPVDEKTEKVCVALQNVAERKSTKMTSIALAYVMHKYHHVTPIVGGRRVEHLLANIEALKVELTDEDIQELESASDFDLGFPSNLFGLTSLHKAPGVAKMLANGGQVAFVEPVKPIKPSSILAGN